MESNSYLNSRGTDISKLKSQFSGRKFGELVLHHTKTQSLGQIEDAISGLYGQVHPELQDTTDKFLATVLEGFSQSELFWKEDCGNALEMYVNSTKSEAKKFGIEVDDDYGFDIFNLMVLLLAKKVIQEPDFKKLVRKSTKSFRLF
jgi:hypothetical protein